MRLSTLRSLAAALALAAVAAAAPAQDRTPPVMIRAPPEMPTL